METIATLTTSWLTNSQAQVSRLSSVHLLLRPDHLDLLVKAPVILQEGADVALVVGFLQQTRKEKGNPEQPDGNRKTVQGTNVLFTLLLMKSLILFLGYWSFRSRSKKTVTNGVGCWMKIARATIGCSLSCSTQTSAPSEASQSESKTGQWQENRPSGRQVGGAAPDTLCIHPQRSRCWGCSCPGS